VLDYLFLFVHSFDTSIVLRPFFCRQVNSADGSLELALSPIIPGEWFDADGKVIVCGVREE
jgi:hypothetical protein